MNKKYWSVRRCACFHFNAASVPCHCGSEPLYLFIKCESCDPKAEKQPLMSVLLCVPQRLSWPSADPRSHAAPLAAPRGLWMGAAAPHVRQQVPQLQSCRWWDADAPDAESTPLGSSYTCVTLSDYGEKLGAPSWTVHGQKVVKSAPVSSPKHLKLAPNPSDQVWSSAFLLISSCSTCRFTVILNDVCLAADSSAPSFRLAFGCREANRFALHRL